MPHFKSRVMHLGLSPSWIHPRVIWRAFDVHVPRKSTKEDKTSVETVTRDFKYFLLLEKNDDPYLFRYYSLSFESGDISTVWSKHISG